MTTITTWLDRLLGRVTMYVLVIIALTFLALVGLVLSLTGQFGWGPLELLASAAVLIVVANASNWVIGRILHVQPQTGSSIITALLLLFIFQPTLDPIGLLWLAAAALVASASKYLLAVRGRHVFNPAAVGAFVIGLLPIISGTYVAWWPGTSAMLPFTVVTALAILFRTRKLLLGVVFVAVATVGWTVSYLTFGGGPTDGAMFAILAYPTVFFAGFMLSEPLTLPPRRWQQLLEAAVVGVVFAVPFSFFGLFSSSPQFALLVGNLLAFWFGQRRGIRLEFVAKTQLAPTSWEFEFAPAHPVRFTPGQFMELTLPHPKTDSRGWRRVFSIASAPGDGRSVRFGIRLPETSSAFKRALLALEPGATISATSVGGDFVLPRDGSRLLLVAGGIGITPYVAQLEQLASEGSERDVALVYAIRNADDLAYAARLAKTPCSVTIVSPEKPAKLPRGWKWVASDRLTGDQLIAAVPDASQRHAYLSGSPEWVGRLKGALRRAGAKRIHTDVFVGY